MAPKTSKKSQLEAEALVHPFGPRPIRVRKTDADFNKDMFLWRTQELHVEDANEVFVAAKGNNIGAEYSDVMRSYCTDIRAYSPQDYALVPSIIESGPHAGLKCIIFAPRAPFPIERLPAEIRVMIFAIVLARGPLEMVYDCKRVRASIRRERLVKNRQAHLGALLSVNRLFHAESHALMYQLNTPRFDSFPSLNTWLQNLGSKRPLVTAISFMPSGGGFNKETVACVNSRETCELLATCSRLRSVKFEVYYFETTKQYRSRISQMIKSLRHFFAAAGAPQTEKRRRCDLIEFSFVDRRGRDVVRLAEELNSDVRRTFDMVIWIEKARRTFDVVLSKEKARLLTVG